jgi:hypothetical protein
MYKYKYISITTLLCRFLLTGILVPIINGFKTVAMGLTINNTAWEVEREIQRKEQAEKRIEDIGDSIPLESFSLSPSSYTPSSSLTSSQSSVSSFLTPSPADSAQSSSFLSSSIPSPFNFLKKKREKKKK